MKNNNKAIGKISQVIGAVVDVVFERQEESTKHLRCVGSY